MYSNKSGIHLNSKKSTHKKLNYINNQVILDIDINSLNLNKILPE